MSSPWVLLSMMYLLSCVLNLSGESSSLRYSGSIFQKDTAWHLNELAVTWSLGIAVDNLLFSSICNLSEILRSVSLEGLPDLDSRVEGSHLLHTHPIAVL